MKRQIQVTQIIEVELDEKKFTPEFLADFNGSIFDASLDDHFEHLAQLYARGIADEFSTFIEGYGPPAEMGIKAKALQLETETLRSSEPARAEA